MASDAGKPEFAAEFKEKPMKAIKRMISKGLLAEDPDIVSNFLLHTPDLDDAAVGDYLSDGDPFCAKVLESYVRNFSFIGLGFDDGLRKFLSAFRLPGEAQKIERIMNVFSAQYYAHNPNCFRSADTAFKLAYSVIMLNTDAHNPNIKPKKKMTKEQFLRNNRGLDDDHDLPREFLEAIYDRITTNEIIMEPYRNDASDRSILAYTNPYKDGWLKKQSRGVISWSERWFVLKNDCLFYLRKPPVWGADCELCGHIPLHEQLVAKPDTSGGPQFVLEMRDGTMVRDMKIDKRSKIMKQVQLERLKLVAPSPAEMAEWVKTVNFHVDTLSANQKLGSMRSLGGQEVASYGSATTYASGSTAATGSYGSAAGREPKEAGASEHASLKAVEEERPKREGEDAHGEAAQARGERRNVNINVHRQYHAAAASEVDTSGSSFATQPSFPNTPVATPGNPPRATPPSHAAAPRGTHSVRIDLGRGQEGVLTLPHALTVDGGFEARIRSLLAGEEVWPLGARDPQLSAIRLALAGFFFEPNADYRDRVVCRACELSVGSWEPSDDPMEAHINFVKDARPPTHCAYVKNHAQLYRALCAGEMSWEVHSARSAALDLASRTPGAASAASPYSATTTPAQPLFAGNRQGAVGWTHADGGVRGGGLGAVEASGDGSGEWGDEEPEGGDGLASLLSPAVPIASPTEPPMSAIARKAQPIRHLSQLPPATPPLPSVPPLDDLHADEAFQEALGRLERVSQRLVVEQHYGQRLETLTSSLLSKIHSWVLRLKKEEALRAQLKLRLDQLQQPPSTAAPNKTPQSSVQRSVERGAPGHAADTAQRNLLV